MSRFKLLSQNVRDRKIGYFQHMNMTMNEHTPRLMIAVMIPASSNDGTEIEIGILHEYEVRIYISAPGSLLDS